jgi:hypothetical protein
VAHVSRLRVAGLWAGLVATLTLLSACTSDAPPFLAATVPHGRLAQEQGVWVLLLDGTPEERGDAAGRLIGAQIRWALPRFLRAGLKTEAPGGYPAELARRLSDRLPAEHHAELTSLARSAGVDREQLLIANLSPELAYSMLCSALGVAGARSPDGTVRLARNLDWIGGKVMRSIALVVVESGAEHTFVSFGYAGILGVVTGMNDVGLSAANLVVLGVDPRAESGVPVLFALRRMLETAADAESAARWLLGTPRTVAQNYVLADPQTALVLETAPDRFRRRDAAATGFVAVANLFDEDQNAPPESRVETMTAIARTDPLDVARLQSLLHRVALGELNIQAAILEPAARVAHLSLAGTPAAGGPYTRIELAPYLGPSAAGKGP